MKQFILFTLLLAFILSACKGPQIITIPLHDSTSVVITEDITDSYIWTDPDSVWYRFALECDSNYNVLLKSYHEINTGIETEVIIREKVRWRTDGTKVNQLQFSILGYVDSLAMRDRTINRLRKELSSVEIAVPVEVPVKFTPKWIKRLAWIGAGSILLIILFIAYKIFKPKIPFL